MAEETLNPAVTTQVTTQKSPLYSTHITTITTTYKRGSKMNLRQRILDAVLDGKLGTGVIVTRPEVIAHFPDVSMNYTGVVLSNAEMDTGTHSPTWEHYTHRIARGVYRISPTALAERLNERRDSDTV